MPPPAQRFTSPSNNTTTGGVRGHNTRRPAITWENRKRYRNALLSDIVQPAAHRAFAVRESLREATHGFLRLIAHQRWDQQRQEYLNSTAFTDPISSSATGSLGPSSTLAAALTATVDVGRTQVCLLDWLCQPHSCAAFDVESIPSTRTKTDFIPPAENVQEVASWLDGLSAASYPLESMEAWQVRRLVFRLLLPQHRTPEGVTVVLPEQVYYALQAAVAACELLDLLQCALVDGDHRELIYWTQALVIARNESLATAADSASRRAPPPRTSQKTSSTISNTFSAILERFRSRFRGHPRVALVETLPDVFAAFLRRTSRVAVWCRANFRTADIGSLSWCVTKRALPVGQLTSSETPSTAESCVINQTNSGPPTLRRPLMTTYGGGDCAAAPNDGSLFTASSLAISGSRTTCAVADASPHTGGGSSPPPGCVTVWIRACSSGAKGQVDSYDRQRISLLAETPAVESGDSTRNGL